MSYSIFLSHAGADLPLVRSIQEAARVSGVAVYAYEDDPTPGLPLPEKLLMRICDSNAVIALVTSDAVKSPAVNQEIGAARQAQKLVIPIVEKGIDPLQLTLLQGLEYLTFDRDDPLATVQMLSGRLRNLKERHENAVAIGLLILGGFAIWAAHGT